MDKHLTCLFSVVDCIADLFGQNCEVVLHDLSNPLHSIIKIRNGHVTGRKVGGSLTDASFKQIRDAEKGVQTLGNYNAQTKDGRLLKSNSVNIRDESGKLVGFVCINLDLSPIIKYQNSIQEANRMINDILYVSEKSGLDAVDEHFEKDVWSTLKEVIQRFIKETGKEVDQFTKKDRYDLISKLDEKGLFYIKSAIPFIAKFLRISSPTVYRHLREIKMGSGGKISVSVQKENEGERPSTVSVQD